MLEKYEPETIYLIGDIFDFPTWDWTPVHQTVVKEIFLKQSKVIYLPGNHDAILRIFNGLKIGNLLCVNSIIHTTADEKRYFVIHGDQFDCTLRYIWVGHVISIAYKLCLRFGFNDTARYCKAGINKWIMKVSHFKAKAIRRAKAQRTDGIICGHIHMPELTEKYINTGDWTDHCSAVIEHFDGRLELI